MISIKDNKRLISMSIKLNDSKSKLKKNNFKHLKIEVQCPDCGCIFRLNEEREYFCKNCNRVFYENEIRERCGL